MESSSWSVVLASPSLAIVESFSLSVSTEELTSVPGTSLQPNKAIINHEDKISIGSETKIIPRCIRGDEGEVDLYVSGFIPVGTGVPVTFTENNTPVPSLLAGTGLGFTTLLTGTTYPQNQIKRLVISHGSHLNPKNSLSFSSLTSCRSGAPCPPRQSPRSSSSSCRWAHPWTSSSPPGSSCEEESGNRILRIIKPRKP